MKHILKAIISLVLVKTPAIVNAEDVSDQLTVRHTNFTHMKLSGFLDGGDPYFDAVDGKRYIFCDFPVNKKFERRLRWTIDGGKQTKIFHDDSVVAVMFRDGVPILKFNAWGQINVDNEKTIELTESDFEFVYGLFLGASLNFCDD